MKGMLFALVPTLGARAAVRSGNGLTLMRQACLAFATACTLIWVPVLLVWSDGRSSGVDGRTAALVVVVVGVVLQLLAGVVVAAPVADDEATVRRLAQRSMFLRVALAESAALVGFAGFLFTTNPMVYAAGYVVTLAGLVDAAPTAAKLDRQQQALRAVGSDVELLAVLVGQGLTR